MSADAARPKRMGIPGHGGPASMLADAGRRGELGVDNLAIPGQPWRALGATIAVLGGVVGRSVAPAIRKPLEREGVT